MKRLVYSFEDDDYMVMVNDLSDEEVEYFEEFRTRHPETPLWIEDYTPPKPKPLVPPKPGTAEYLLLETYKNALEGILNENTILGRIFGHEGPEL